MIKSSFALESSRDLSFFGLPPIEFLTFLLPANPPVFRFNASSLSYSSSLTCCLSLLITFWQKWDLLASSFSTSLWISISLLSVSICCFILLFLYNSCSVCLDWYSNSVVSWWFYRIVSLVVVWSCSSFKASRLALVSLIL